MQTHKCQSVKHWGISHPKFCTAGPKLNSTITTQPQEQNMPQKQMVFDILFTSVIGLHHATNYCCPDYFV